MSFFSSLGSFFTSFRNWWAAPETTQAVKNLEATVETVAEAIVCDISAGAGLASSIMQQVNADPSTKGTTDKIYTVSSAVCQALRGTPTGQTASNVPAITSVSGSSS